MAGRGGREGKGERRKGRERGFSSESNSAWLFPSANGCWCVAGPGCLRVAKRMERWKRPDLGKRRGRFGLEHATVTSGGCPSRRKKGRAGKWAANGRQITPWVVHRPPARAETITKTALKRRASINQSFLVSCLLPFASCLRSESCCRSTSSTATRSLWWPGPRSPPLRGGTRRSERTPSWSSWKPWTSTSPHRPEVCFKYSWYQGKRKLKKIALSWVGHRMPKSLPSCYGGVRVCSWISSARATRLTNEKA